MTDDKQEAVVFETNEMLNEAFEKICVLGRALGRSRKEIQELSNLIHIFDRENIDMAELLVLRLGYNDGSDTRNYDLLGPASDCIVRGLKRLLVDEKAHFANLTKELDETYRKWRGTV